MKPPCAKCPFRAKYKGDQDYLRVGRRADIARSILEGADFPCHETVDYEDDDDGFGIANDANAVSCVGLDLVQLRANRMGQSLRIRSRIGLVKPEALLRRGRNIKLWTWDEVLDDGRDDGEPCSIVGPNCEAPAGYMFGGEVVHGTEFLTDDDICPTCGEHICPECMDSYDHGCNDYETEPTSYFYQQRSPRYERTFPHEFDREATRIPPQAQRSRSRRDRPGLPPDGPPLGTGT